MKIHSDWLGKYARYKIGGQGGNFDQAIDIQENSK